MSDFTFSDIRGVSITLREEDDELNSTPEPSSEAELIFLNDPEEKSSFPQVSNLFIIVAVVLVVAVLINFILRRRRIQFGRIPNAPSTTPPGRMPTVPDGTNSLYPDSLPTYDTQSHHHPGHPPYQAGQPSYHDPQATYPYQHHPYGTSQSQGYPQRQQQHTSVPFG